MSQSNSAVDGLLEVDIVVVSWNSASHLRNCIANLPSKGKYIVYNLVVVDNGSADDSVAQVTELLARENKIPAHHIIANATNLGFAAACNQGAASGDAEFLLFLNPDTQLQPESVNLAANYLHEHSDTGVVGIQLVNETGTIQRSCARQPTSGSLLCHALGLDRIWPRFGYMMSAWPHTNSANVEHVIGAFYLIRRDLFKHLDGFDERYFVYLEDLDLSKRVLATGRKIHYLAEANAMHVGGGSSQQVPVRRLFYSLRTRLQFTHKHHAWPTLIAVCVASLVAEPLVRTFAALVTGSTSTAVNTVKAYGHLWRWILQGMKSGREL